MSPTVKRDTAVRADNQTFQQVFIRGNGTEEPTTGSQHTFDLGDCLPQSFIVKMLQNLTHDDNIEGAIGEGYCLRKANSRPVTETKPTAQRRDAGFARVKATDAQSCANQQFFEPSAPHSDVQDFVSLRAALCQETVTGS